MCSPLSTRVAELKIAASSTMMVKSINLFFLGLATLSFGVVSAAECDAGSVSAYATGANALTYGAPSDGGASCVEFCIPQAILQFARGAVAGTCASQGYTMLVEEGKTVQLPGSPNPLEVNIYSEEEEDGKPSVEINKGNDWNPSVFGGPCVDCEEYVELSAEEKLERIWNKILAYEYEELPTNWLRQRTNPTVTEMIQNFPDKSRVNMIFDRVSDERPPDFPRMLHEYGSIAKVAWVPNRDSIFTGFYNEGSEYGIIRITFCAPFDGSLSGSRVPLAFAAKFFRDGIHSSNIPTCEGTDRNYRGRDPAGFSVFKHPLHTTTVINPPIDSFFANAQNGTGALSIADNTWYSQDGTPVQDPVAPLIVHFFPNDALNTKQAYEEDFRLELVDVPINSTLYTAYTPVDDDGNPTICICHSTEEGGIPCFLWDSLTANCKLVELGTLVTRSEFVHSDYGDNAVLFKHYRSCQEDRKYCEYNEAIPDSTFTKSANRNGTCVSRRRVMDYDGVCPFLNNNSGLQLIDAPEYCSTPDEKNLEKMCPFANALHPAFSGHGVPYPLTPDEHLRSCSVGLSFKATVDFPLVSIGCCRAMAYYFDDSQKAGALPTLCNMADCRAEFQAGFPDIDLVAECRAVGAVEECKFDLQAGPSTFPINLGFVSADCCAAARIHSNSSSGADASDAALGTVCAEVGCIAAYESLYQQGQAFANPSSTESLVDVCSAKAPEETPDVTTTSAGVSHSGTTFCAVLSSAGIVFLLHFIANF